MNYAELIEQRHSVREYLDKSLPGEVKDEIMKYLNVLNQEANTHFQLVVDAPHVFHKFSKPAGRFENAKHYVALVSNRSVRPLEIGYYGQKLVLFLQGIGLNTCWIASTFEDDPSTYVMKDREALALIIALGYGQNPGIPHISKPKESTYKIKAKSAPDWFIPGVEAALLAPTARNQQNYRIVYHEQGIELIDLGGRWSEYDLGIIKLHFELGSKQENLVWL